MLRLFLLGRLQKKTKEINYKIGNHMNEEEIKTLYNIVDKLEKRIATLEKVLESHAKCIGEMREDKKDHWHSLPDAIG